MLTRPNDENLFTACVVRRGRTSTTLSIVDGRDLYAGLFPCYDQSAVLQIIFWATRDVRSNDMSCEVQVCFLVENDSIACPRLASRD
jgi:hypothetical protein